MQSIEDPGVHHDRHGPLITNQWTVELELANDDKGRFKCDCKCEARKIGEQPIPPYVTTVGCS